MREVTLVRQHDCKCRMVNTDLADLRSELY